MKLRPGVRNQKCSYAKRQQRGFCCHVCLHSVFLDWIHSALFFLKFISVRNRTWKSQKAHMRLLHVPLQNLCGSGLGRHPLQYVIALEINFCDFGILCTVYLNYHVPLLPNLKTAYRYSLRWRWQVPINFVFSQFYSIPCRAHFVTACIQYPAELVITTPVSEHGRSRARCCCDRELPRHASALRHSFDSCFLSASWMFGECFLLHFFTYRCAAPFMNVYARKFLW